MKRIGIFIECKNGRLKDAVGGVVTAARCDGGELYALLLEDGGDDGRAALESWGVHTIVDIRGENGPLPYHPSRWAGALARTIRHFDLEALVGLSSLLGKNLLARVAAELDAPLVLDCTAIDAARHTAVKTLYSGKTRATLQTKGAVHLYGIRPNAVAPRSSPSRANRTAYSVVLPDDPIRLREIQRSADSGVDLTEADTIIAGGRGMAGPEAFKLLEDCARPLGAAVGASRVAVDSGWVPHRMQVGQTGKTVTPKVYLAAGISGSVQHFAGMKTAGLVIAVNKDPKAAIIQKCDYFVVADLFDIIPALTEQLNKISSKAQAMR